MKYVLQILPWVIIIVLTTILLRCCSSGSSQLPPSYDSAVSAGQSAVARANDLASGLATEQLKTDSILRVLNASQDQLNQERLRKRANPRVVEVIREIPAVDSAFQADDVALEMATKTNFWLEQRYRGYLYQDSLYHLTRDTVENNLRYRERVAVETLQALEIPGPLSLGVSAGLGAVYSGGQVYAGPGLQVGLSYRIPLRKKSRAARR